mgnify:CR=1 FL=1
MLLTRSRRCLLRAHVAPITVLSSRCLSSDSSGKGSKGLTRKSADGSVAEVKNWGSALELPEITKEQAHEKFLDVTDVKRAMVPPVGIAVKARDDMLHDRFNYVATNLNPAAQYVVMGKKGAVAPTQVTQTGLAMASVCVLMGAITTVVYIKTQWNVSSPKELGDRLREKGAARRQAMEGGEAVKLVRTFSANAENTVKENVEIVRRPSQHLGEHFQESFKGVVKKKPE